MNVYTLHVGQGQFVVVTGAREAFIVDTYIPLSPSVDIINVKTALATILKEKELVGLIITGFDADHFNEVGLRLVLNKYRPNWLMYPKYYKPTGNASRCFAAIEEFESGKNLKRHSISLSENSLRYYNNICSEFYFEVFSPHKDDMNSSNNCSLVCKVVEKSTGATYLITGDTEVERWDSICRYFGTSLKSHIMAAPHHGSENGVTISVMEYVRPDVVLISAGVDNQYGHPHEYAIGLFTVFAGSHYSTNWNGGQSVVVTLNGLGLQAFGFSP